MVQTDKERIADLESHIAVLMTEKQKLLDALERQCDNFAFVLNRCTVRKQWFDRFDRELTEDRDILTTSA